MPASFSMSSPMNTSSAGLWRSTRARRVETACIRAAKRVTTVSPALVGLYRDTYGVDRMSADDWAEMWNEQVRLGIVPYYMFVERDTGAKNYFAIPLHEALDVFNLFDSNDDDIAYFYASRLEGEPLAGVEDVHFHPLEPRSARFSVTFSWQ